MSLFQINKIVIERNQFFWKLGHDPILKELRHNILKPFLQSAKSPSNWRKPQHNSLLRYKNTKEVIITKLEQGWLNDDGED